MQLRNWFDRRINDDNVQLWLNCIKDLSTDQSSNRNLTRDYIADSKANVSSHFCVARSFA